MSFSVLLLLSIPFAIQIANVVYDICQKRIINYDL